MKIKLQHEETGYIIEVDKQDFIDDKNKIIELQKYRRYYAIENHIELNEISKIETR
jgi:hypothetical protein